MAGFRKRPADGEAGSDFKSINATGTTRDPTQNGRRPDSVTPAGPNSPTGTGVGTGQWNPGKRDDQGAYHD